MSHRLKAVLLAAVVVLVLTPFTSVASADTATTRYTVVLAGTATTGGFDLAGTRQAALDLVVSAGGKVTLDLSKQIGVLGVESSNALFLNVVRSSPLVNDAAEEHVWKSIPTYDEAVASRQLTVVSEANPPCNPDEPGCRAPEPHEDPLEPLQWSMEQIRAPEAHAIQAGVRSVQVGILDTGIDGMHLDFVLDEDGTNVDCANGRNFVPAGPGVGVPDPCTDNNFHGTHVAGIVAARANSHGVVGVAPNVTLIPVKVCDTAGYCYSNASAAGIAYAGDAKFEVINMSYFVDDDQLLASTEFKCMSDPVQRTFRKANERAINYARNQGVVPVAALGNSASDLAHPPEPYENECDVVPAESRVSSGRWRLAPRARRRTTRATGSG